MSPSIVPAQGQSPDAAPEAARAFQGRGQQGAQRGSGTSLQMRPQQLCKNTSSLGRDGLLQGSFALRGGRRSSPTSTPAPLLVPGCAAPFGAHFSPQEPVKSIHAIQKCKCKAKERPMELPQGERHRSVPSSSSTSCHCCPFPPLPCAPTPP